MSLLAFLLACAGFAALCLGSSRHARHACQTAAHPSTPAETVALRVLGWGLLALALPPAILIHGMSIGIAVWFGLASVAALAVGLLLTYQPRLLAALGPALVVRALRALRPAPDAADR